MAKVGTEFFQGADFSSRLDFGVYFSKKEGFYAKVPEAILARTNKVTQVDGADYDGAVKNMKEYLAQVMKESLVTKKVIAYYFAYRTPHYSAHYPNRDYNAEPERVKDWHSGPNLKSGRGWSSWDREPRQVLKLDYEVLYHSTYYEKQYVSETDPAESASGLKEAKLYRCSEQGANGYTTNKDFNEWDLLDHTPELEEWFNRTAKAMEELTSKVADFFGKSQQHLLESIATNGHLLAAPAPAETPNPSIV